LLRRHDNIFNYTRYYADTPESTSNIKRPTSNEN